MNIKVLYFGVGTIVVGAMIVGAMIVGTMIVGAMIVGTMVVGAMIVGAMRRPPYPFQVCVIMIRLGERMTIKLRKNIMFRGLQRWDGCDRFT